MLITRKDIIKLKELATASDLVEVDSIPTNLKIDFDLFFLGKTFLRKGDVNFAYPHDIKKWVRFLVQKYKRE